MTTTRTSATSAKAPRKPTGKLAFAYDTIMQLEAQVAELRAGSAAPAQAAPARAPKAADEEKAVVRYGRHPLDIAEVQQHIAQGKLPTKLALTWGDRVSLVLTEGLQLRKLEFLDSVLDGQDKDGGGFDADVAIATGELTKLIPDLIEALGGESERGALPDAQQVQGAVKAFRALDALAKKDGYTMELSTGSGEVLATFGAGQDPLYDQAVALVRSPNGKASISYVQRKLLIGYHRADQLMNDMEKSGVVSHADAHGVRAVLAQGGAA